MKSSKDLLLQFVRYNLWANKALCSLLETFEKEQLDSDTKSSFPSIRKTAFHIWDAEYIWLSRFKGVSLDKFPSAELTERTPVSSFVKGAEDFLAFTEKQNDDFFSGFTTFKDMHGAEHTMENSGMIFHCMNHSSFHRGQIVSSLRILGYEGEMPRTDMIVYLRELSQN